MSRKNVYGIENELHLVEHIQKCLKLIFTHELLNNGELSIQILDDIFRNLKLRLAKDRFEGIERDYDFMKPELDLHMHVALKIAYNLRDLTMN